VDISDCQYYNRLCSYNCFHIFTRGTGITFGIYGRYGCYTFDVLLVAVVFFSSVTYLMIDNQVFTDAIVSERRLTPGLLADFFLWHFFKAIPLLDVTTTLKWDEPATYESSFIGMVRLIFKLAVIIPSIAAFTWTWNRIDKGPAGTLQVSDKANST